jgi:peptidoglycan/xylan/chitin deacetylase (PgdA/CDA1 family)
MDSGSVTGNGSNSLLLRVAGGDAGAVRQSVDAESPSRNEWLKRDVRVLMYHRIGPGRPDTYPGLTVSPKKFERQIRWLARRGYVGIRLLEWIAGNDLPKKPIVVTFDDAYADTAEYALPILRRYGFSAVVFVVTQRVGRTNTWDEAHGCGTLRLMTAEQIEQWAAEGIEFGAHSRTHPDLTTLSDEECTAEIAGSRSDLEALLGERAFSFAYPYGAYDGNVRDLVAKHFAMGFSTEEGLNGAGADPYLLRRVRMGPDDSIIGFALSVWMGGNWRGRVALRTRLRDGFARLIGRQPRDDA